MQVEEASKLLNLYFHLTLEIIMYVSLKSFHQIKTRTLICKSFVAKMKLQFPKMSCSIKTDPVLLYTDETYRLLT